MAEDDKGETTAQRELKRQIENNPERYAQGSLTIFVKSVDEAYEHVARLQEGQEAGFASSKRILLPDFLRNFATPLSERVQTELQREEARYTHEIKSAEGQYCEYRIRRTD
jgi:hypothetical protein